MDRAGDALRIGTRGSALALAQTQRVIDLLRGGRPGLVVAPVVIRTEGDADKSTPLTILGGRGVFTSGLQHALLAGEIAAAVHSAKDLPGERPAGLVLAAFPEREDPRDVIVSRHGRPLAELPAAPTIGTSSRRRAAQIRRLRPDATIVDLRGNIDTRLRRALDEELDAIVLAAAGVTRMGWSDRITQWLTVDEFIPAPGQGALAVEAREDDTVTRDLLATIDNPGVTSAVGLERAFLAAVGGGCTKPIGAYVEPAGAGWRLRAMIADDTGLQIARADTLLAAGDPAGHVAEMACELLAQVEPALAQGQGGASSPELLETAMTTSAPLRGVTVVVTRPRNQAAPLVAALREHGAEPLEVPAIRIEPVPGSPELTRALTGLVVGDYDWVVFTSVNAVEHLLAQLAAQGRGWPAGRSPRVVAVGAATAAALAAAGITVDLRPEVADAESVVAALSQQRLTGQRLLYPKGDQARDLIPVRLRRAGAQVDAVDVYRTVPEPAIDPAIRDRILAGAVDVITFASPSSVRGLIALLGDASALGPAEIVCIGPVTAEAARAEGLTVHGVGGDASVAGIVAAVRARRAAGTPAIDEASIAGAERAVEAESGERE